MSGKSGARNETRFARFSAFGSTLDGLRDLVRELVIDIAALQRPLSRCDLGRCRGTCCHDGVYLDRDEVGVLFSLVRDHRDDLNALGLELPDQPIIQGNWRGVVSGPKTATRSEPMAANAEDYPAHFPDTACVFLLSDARCALQQFAMEQGRDPWFYKPATCWLHPLAIERNEKDVPLLTLHGPETDPQRFPDYDGFASRTPCGVSPAVGGRAAWEVLSQEISRLGEIGGRDLLAEIRTGVGEK